MMALYMQALLGGMLIGLSAVLLLLLNGRVAGISGIVGRLLDGKQISGNLLFIIGLLMGPVVYAWIFGAFPATDIAASWPVMLIAGLLVGVGTRMGSGCTSGHGIVGLARFSRRSLVATIVFLIAGVIAASLAGAFL
ncbi:MULTISPECIES: YeeE/YedE family protein [Brucella]|uniref:YeeE/YedE family protein n=1 Tax=Brucella TaxID=234 RepID=UPI0001B594A7|nr:MULTISPECIES: YeeE/YedE family protein [Brucella]EEX85533.1 YeeE/YedE [Brucella ceti B1/94]EEZ06815.1 YeeE/YedE [Brucella ceti M490/95/1]ENT05856.1 hypothetical protein C983_02586 [Brucella sp. F23/97]ENT13000.1 hypothetical protein B998_03170 [Brucella sp. F96/2]ENT19946.1 hypothetical protein C065_02311 [Brucella sp. UK1/97]